MALMMQGADTSPVQHWTQGAARVAQSIIGGLELNREDQKEAKEKNAAREMYSPLVQQLFGGQAASPAAPAAPRSSPVASIDPSSLTSPQSAPVKDVYDSNEQSPLDPVPGAMTPNMKRLAAAIYAGESGGRPNVMYGGKTFDSYADHPRQPQPIGVGPNAGNVSTAAGLGQFIAPTWDRAKKALNLQDFSPGNQNAATAYTASEDFRKRTGGDLEAAMTQAGNDPQRLQQIARALAPTWTSLPGGIEQNAAGAQFAQNAAVQPTLTDASAQRVTTPGQPQINGGAISQMLGNKYTAPFAQGLINQKVQEQFKQQDYDFQKMEDGSIVAINKKNPRDYRVINPVDPQAMIAHEASKKGAIVTAEEQAKRAVAQPEKDKQAKATADIVTTDIDRTIKGIDGSALPATGFIGNMASKVPGTAAHDVSKLLDTIKANAGFDTLAKMRAASPTGGALGSITEKELALLQATVGNLEQSQTADQLKDNLRRVKNTYLDIVHGAGNGPAREAMTFQQPAGAPDKAAIEQEMRRRGLLK
jgi:muramidase (phage lysozyme)